MTIRNLQEAEERLAQFVPAVKKQAVNYSLDRMQAIMQRLGSPQDKIRIVHVAGTSGKTSTCYYLTSLFVSAGLKVGTTVSPHVDSVTERLQINGVPLSEDLFCQYLEEFLSLLDLSLEPTYFEVLIAFVYWVLCVKEKVDIAVIETGCGGSLDGTNVVSRAKKFCVITDIGFDHMHLLGYTIESIASHKAGIIHEGNRAIMYHQSIAVDSVFTMRAKQVNATILQIDPTADLAAAPDMMPLFQMRNWLLARRAFHEALVYFGIDSEDFDETATAMTYVPARMEERYVLKGAVISDGAHNEQKMHAFVSSYIAKYGDDPVVVLLSLKKDKDHAAVLKILQPITKMLIVTEFYKTQDLPVAAESAESLAVVARGCGFSDVVVEPDYHKAMDLLESGMDRRAIITGSFYLISQLRADNK